jgi:phosphoheptose isomerase
VTKAQINRIAAATKQICDTHGYGHQVVVWASGAYSEAISSNDIVGRFVGDDREYPLVRFSTPTSRADATEAIREAERERTRAYAL